jgi:hypothetical protein
MPVALLLAVKVVEVPLHIVSGEGLIVTPGEAVTLIVALAVEVQLPPSLTVTV